MKDAGNGSFPDVFVDGPALFGLQTAFGNIADVNADSFAPPSWRRPTPARSATCRRARASSPATYGQRMTSVTFGRHSDTSAPR